MIVGQPPGICYSIKSQAIRNAFGKTSTIYGKIVSIINWTENTKFRVVVFNKS
jgi:hypothetical protein